MGWPEGERWFIPGKASTGAGPMDLSCQVEAFVDAEEYYSALRKAIEACTNSGSPGACWFFWIGFECSGDAFMPATAPKADAVKKYPPRLKGTDDVDLLDLLRQADAKGVKLRALLTLHPKPDTSTSQDRYKIHNFTLCQTINKEFKNAFAINDFRYLYMNGVHHQKVFIVYDGRALTAFAGGLDLEKARIRSSWCDFHCRFVGRPAEYLYSVFQQRWAEHFLRQTPAIGFDAAHEKLLTPAFHIATSGTLVCQIATTYGNPRHANPFSAFPTNQSMEQHINLPHRLKISAPFYPGPGAAALGLYLSAGVAMISNKFFATNDPDGTPILLHEQNQLATHTFAPSGHHAIYDLVKNAIAQTAEFIYLEDQFLVCDQPMGQAPNRLVSMLDLLKAKVAEKSFKRLVILTTRIDEINDGFQNTGWAHRSAFIRDLHAAGPDKVAICQYRSNKQLGRGGDPESSPFYIHSKTWIFDDKLLISGSANCNRRGYSHDSELDFALYDVDEAWVRETRARLWMRRLNTEGCFKAPTLAELRDPNNATAWDRWFKPYNYSKDLESSAYTKDQGTERRGQLSDFAPVAHPDKSPSQLESDVNKLLKPTGLQVKVTGTINQYLWDNVVDPDGL